MQTPQSKETDFKARLLYGAVVGALFGMIIGTMPGNDPWVGVLSMVLAAVVVSALAVLSESFWESMRAAWELVRMAFWRW